MFPTGLVQAWHSHHRSCGKWVCHFGDRNVKKYSYELYVFDNCYSYQKHTVQNFKWV